MKSLHTMILLLVCGIGLANAQILPAAPNFLFIFIDDQAWDATSVQMIPGESFSHTASYRMPNLEQNRIGRHHFLASLRYAPQMRRVKVRPPDGAHIDEPQRS